MTRTTWLIEPRDPLITRDGRPFTSDPGVRAQSLPFPMPSTLAGVVRTLAGSDQDGVFTLRTAQALEKLKEIQVWGPLLAEVADGGEVELMFPTPADALTLHDKASQVTLVHRLTPISLRGGEVSDLEGFLKPVALPLGTPDVKPETMPAFWSRPAFEGWLTDGRADYTQLGHGGPKEEERSHVVIRPGQQTALEGGLFQTRGREYTHTRTPPGSTHVQLSSATRLGLLLQTDARIENFNGGFRPLGGERRLARWYQLGQRPLFDMPSGLLERINRYCRIILLTPGHFAQGYLPRLRHTGGEGEPPEWEQLSTNGVSVRLHAMACSRYHTVSGWDFAARTPKPTRRLLPAGAVFFVELRGSPAEVKAWCRNTWMNPVGDSGGADGDQAGRDGFGLAVLGAWEGVG